LADDELPQAVIEPPRRRIQLVWIIPIVAALAGGWIAVTTLLAQGPESTISFRTAEGLEAGKTKIRYKDVEIGLITHVALAPDGSGVVANAQFAKEATNLLVEDTKFWVVKPRVSSSSVSGLGTLFSGSYLGLDVGKSQVPRRHFVGLEVAPIVTADVPGTRFTLHSDDIGSLGVGSPVYYRRIEVGQVVSFDLDPDGSAVTLQVFVNAPYDQYVTTNTRFWHASGIDVSLDTTGVQINTQSLVSIMIGGIAFETPADSTQQPAAAPRASFALFPDRAEAMKRHDRLVNTYVVSFTSSVRGLTVGAPVDFRGIVIGEVTGIFTRFDRVTRQFSIPVEINLYPERFTSRYMKGASGGRLSDNPRQMADFLVAQGMRFQLRTGNLLTGQLYLAADFFPDVPKAKVDWAQNPPELPTIPGALQSLQDSAARLMTKLNGVPFDAIGQNAQQTLLTANALLARLDKEVVPQARDALGAAHTAIDSANSALQPDSSLQQNTGDAMRELARTAAAFRTLADYLERHPEALVRGKAEDRP